MPPDTFTTEPLYTVPEIAEYLRCSTRTIFDLIHRGDLHAIKIGRLTRVTASQLATYLDQPSHT